MKALVWGVVTQTDDGCLAIDDRVLLAPPGSEYLGGRLQIPGYPEVPLGERGRWGGGYTSVDLADYDGGRCGSGKTKVVVVGSPGTQVEGTPSSA